MTSLFEMQKLSKGGERRLPQSPSGIIGGLCRLNYPGLVTLPNGIIEPAWSWDHYKLAPDFLDMR